MSGQAAPGAARARVATVCVYGITAALTTVAVVAVAAGDWLVAGIGAAGVAVVLSVAVSAGPALAELRRRRGEGTSSR